MSDQCLRSYWLSEEFHTHNHIINTLILLPNHRIFNTPSFFQTHTIRAVFRLETGDLKMHRRTNSHTHTAHDLKFKQGKGFLCILLKPACTAHARSGRVCIPRNLFYCIFNHLENFINHTETLTTDLPTFGTVDQKKPRQSGSSKMYGRIRVNRRVQLRTVCLSLSHTQPESAFNTSLSTACKTHTHTLKVHNVFKLKK